MEYCYYTTNTLLIQGELAAGGLDGKLAAGGLDGELAAEILMQCDFIKRNILLLLFIMFRVKSCPTT